MEKAHSMTLSKETKSFNTIRLDAQQTEKVTFLLQKMACLFHLHPMRKVVRWLQCRCRKTDRTVAFLAFWSLKSFSYSKHYVHLIQDHWCPRDRIWILSPKHHIWVPPTYFWPYSDPSAVYIEWPSLPHTPAKDQIILQICNWEILLHSWGIRSSC